MFSCFVTKACSLISTLLMVDDHLITHSDVSGEGCGSVVERRTLERELGGLKPTSAVLCPRAGHFTPGKYW